MRADYPAGYPISSHNENREIVRARARERERESCSLSRLFLSFRRVFIHTSSVFAPAQSSFNGTNNIWRVNAGTRNAFNSFRSVKTDYLQRVLNPTRLWHTRIADSIGRGGSESSFLSGRLVHMDACHDLARPSDTVASVIYGSTCELNTRLIGVSGWSMRASNMCFI